ncbi:MAG: serine dehydratase, partial [Herminiimonas sp.]|nr:serine dehydratase [Herminiimonas sp.]
MDQQAITITHADISAASANLNGVAHRTPVLTSRQANEKTGAKLFFKC